MNVYRLQSKPTAERGSAVLIMLILLVLMGVIMVSNGIVLRQLKRELKLIEAQQLKRSGAPAAITKARERTREGQPPNAQPLPR
jgi:hypothetical protein